MKSVLKELQKQNQGNSNEKKKLAALAQAYNHAMERINGQMPGFQQLAKKVLSWITCAKRPLTTSELRHALAVKPDDSELDEDNLRDIEHMVSVCAGLVTVDESSIIRLVHYTTQEYFERTQRDWLSSAESDIATTCVTYLSFRVFKSGFCRTDKEFEERLRSNRLYDYAACNWGYHAYKAATLIQTITDFLNSDIHVQASVQAMMVDKRISGLPGYSQNAPMYMRGPHLAAYFGLKNAMNALLTHRYDLDSKDDYGRTPLSRAAEGGHEAVVKLLLDERADLDVNCKDRNGRTALLWAAEKGHEAVVQQLLEKRDDLDVNCKDGDGWTALLRAAANGDEAVVKLLEKRADLDVNCKDDYSSRTALWWAAAGGREAMVELLLEKGADADSKDRYGWTPLTSAVQNGHEAVVQLLLAKYRVDPDSKDNSGQTPLLWAAHGGA